MNGGTHPADAAALQAQSDLTAAYNDAAGRTPVTTIPVQLGGTTLISGVYDSLSGTFDIRGTLTLDATGDPDGAFIFKMGTTLVTMSNERRRARSDPSQARGVPRTGARKHPPRWRSGRRPALPKEGS